AEPPLAAPQSKAGTAKPADEQSDIVPVSVKPDMPSIKKELQTKLGHADDYSWVTGQLMIIHAAGQSMWVCRFATVDEEDKYGGSVVLTTSTSMKNFREGDLVTVEG